MTTSYTNLQILTQYQRTGFNIPISQTQLWTEAGQFFPWSSSIQTPTTSLSAHHILGESILPISARVPRGRLNAPKTCSSGAHPKPADLPTNIAIRDLTHSKKLPLSACLRLVLSWVALGGVSPQNYDCKWQ